MEGVAATRADMVDFSGVFDSWAAWLSTQLHAHASEHANFVSESVEEVTALRTKQQELALAQQQNNKGGTTQQTRTVAPRAAKRGPPRSVAQRYSRLALSLPSRLIHCVAAELEGAESSGSDIAC